jgi:hypothetical protein
MCSQRNFMDDKHESERKVAMRLVRAGRCVDVLVARVRAAGGVHGHVARRVDALRANEALVHARLREMREADDAIWAARGVELGRLLDELEGQIAIATMRLQVEQAVDDAAFAAAVHAELDAWSNYADIVVFKAAAAAESPVARRLQAAVLALREQLAVAGRSLANPTDNAAVRQALLDLDRASDAIAWLHGGVS